MKTWVPLLMLGFGVTLAIVIGQRMSTDAMAVVIGVAVGVAASVPTSILLVSLLRRERRPYQNDQMSYGGMPPYGQMPQPPVIVVNPGNGMPQANQQYVPLPPPDQQVDGGMRRLRVVGGNDEWGNGDW